MRSGTQPWTSPGVSLSGPSAVGSGVSPAGTAREMIDNSLSKPSSFEGWFLDAAVYPWLETMLRVKPSMFPQARISLSRSLR